MSRIIVTGATSLLGRKVVDRLAERGDRVTTFQRHPDALERLRNSGSGIPIREVLGDLRNHGDLIQAVRGQDAVIHLAAKVGVTGTWDDFKAINLDGTNNLIQTARGAGVHSFVHVSSPSVAHAGRPLIGASAAPADPTSTRGFYSASKALAEVAALEASTDDLNIVAIRPHLVWGPGDTQLVGRIVDRARSGRLVLIGNGSALIDSTYVDNAADAIVAALDRAALLGGRAFVVSNGQPRTVVELVSRIVLAAGKTPPKRRVPKWVALGGGAATERVWSRLNRTQDPPMTQFLAEQLSTAHWFDQQLTRSLLDWTPTVSIEEGLLRLADWFERTS